MLFNSYTFIFLFLPITLWIYWRLAESGKEKAITWLVISSLFFYGWWNPIYLWLIIGSMLGNFLFGRILSNAHHRHRPLTGKAWLIAGIAANLGLLGYFKYANFAVDSLNAIADTDIHLHNIILPLAISFFTFQQIAYLTDAYKGITTEYRFIHYALFVTFFPQLIAGPIVHHKDMLPQFMRDQSMQPRLQNLAIGLSIFALGLFKKTVLADGISGYSTPVFDAAADGQVLTFFEAWGGALAYTFQLYFDFSGYSDMAIGAARLFGIKLPINFHSPYKAVSITEFWRRWHITLSTFLRDYLYIPLGGNRHGKLMRYRNLMLTMLLGGLWHGAGWTFVIWGGLHGIYLVINHAWTRFTKHLALRRILPTSIGKSLSWTLTFTAIVVGWVFFRAENFDAAISMLQGMAGFNGIALPNAIAARMGEHWQLFADFGFSTYLGGGSRFVYTWLWILFLLPLVLIMPNTQQVLSRFDPALHMHEIRPENEARPLANSQTLFRWQPSRRWAMLTGALISLAILAMTSISEFLYFQF